MLNPVSPTEVSLNSIPEVLLQAKEEATVQASKEEESWDKAWEKGPWDKGHWANRK